ncbi:hypothetical protein GCM10007422_41410 [Pedobacter zeae]|uniref:Uncharacterized protein n=1 Tax=Pedobacter zeae TaxID=1737356 RepID=A0A7W6KEK8_9SPHI|nr:hypothetical protein [Pedobacter zeae]GGH17706.1 hypothetical protein GCM10007422_41410 [Pedobacter zeae]
MTGILPKGGIPVSFLAEGKVLGAAPMAIKSLRPAAKHKKGTPVKKMSLSKIYDRVIIFYSALLLKSTGFFSKY